MIASPCVRGLAHRCDSLSGWCVHGCGYRNDLPSQAAPTTTAVLDITRPLRSPHDD